MRIRLALNSYTRPCGCLIGVYETYDGQIVDILDARGEDCHDGSHKEGTRLGRPRVRALPTDIVGRSES